MFRLWLNNTGDLYSKFGPYNDADTVVDVIPVRATWTDGIDNVAQSATVTLLSLNPAEEVMNVTDFMISPDGVHLFGPYVVERTSVDPEENNEQGYVCTLEGRLDLFIDYHVTDGGESDDVFVSMREQVEALFKIEPFLRFRIGVPNDNVAPITSDHVTNRLFGQLRAATDFSSVISTYKRWGMLPRPYINNELNYEIVVLPRYPVQATGFYADEQFPGLISNNPMATTLSAGGIVTNSNNYTTVRDWSQDVIDVRTISTTNPTSINRPGNYTTRQIKGSTRIFSNIIDDVVHYIEADEGLLPPVYLEQVSGLEFMRMEATLKRWELQYEAQFTNFTRVVTYQTPMEDRYVAPRHSFKYGNIYPESEYMVTRIENSWDADMEDSINVLWTQKITGTLLQDGRTIAVVNPTIVGGQTRPVGPTVTPTPVVPPAPTVEG